MSTATRIKKLRCFFRKVIEKTIQNCGKKKQRQINGRETNGREANGREASYRKDNGRK